MLQNTHRLHSERTTVKYVPEFCLLDKWSLLVFASKVGGNANPGCLTTVKCFRGNPTRYQTNSLSIAACSSIGITAIYGWLHVLSCYILLSQDNCFTDLLVCEHGSNISFLPWANSEPTLLVCITTNWRALVSMAALLLQVPFKYIQLCVRVIWHRGRVGQHSQVHQRLVHVLRQKYYPHI